MYHRDEMTASCLKLVKYSYATVISAYSLTMMNPDDTKENFYEQLNDIILYVHNKDKLIILGDFKGKDHITSPGILGHCGTSKSGTNGLLLLSLCTKNKLSITNTLFQQADKF